MENNSSDRCFTLGSGSLVNSESSLPNAESKPSAVNDNCSQIVTLNVPECDSPENSQLNISQNVEINPSSNSKFTTGQVPVQCQCTVECGNRKNNSSDISSSYRIISGASSNPDNLLDNKFVNQDCGDTDSFIEIENCLKITSAVMKCSRQKDTSNITEESNKFDVDDAESASSFTEMKNSLRTETEVLDSVGLIHKKSSSEFDGSATSYVGSCAKLVSSITNDSHSKKILDFVVHVNNVNAIQDNLVSNLLETAECAGSLENSTDSSCAYKMSTFAQPETVKSSPCKSTEFCIPANESVNQECIIEKQELPSFNEIQPFENDLVPNKKIRYEINRVFDITNRRGRNDENEKSELKKSISEKFDSAESVAYEKHIDNSFVSELISSENINDFFDEMYDMDYRNRVHSGRSNLKDVIVHSVNEKNFVSAPSSVRSQCSENWNKIPNRSITTFGSLGLPKSYIPQVSTNATIRSSLKKTSNEDIDQEYPSCKKSKKGIKFDSVSVYYFPRTQGFTCIPSQGGSTLGMSWNHSHSRRFSLGEHAAEQRRVHRQLCAQQFSSTRNWNEISNVSSDDSDSDEIISDSEMDFENYNFLQPIPTRERRAMLRAAGIHKIDSIEKDECRSIRLSREFCGCTCQVYCDPEKCVCAQAGIKCQVDRMNFPCSCSREGCANENGRIEFNPVRVRTHYIHTLMRLEMEKKKEEEERRNRLILNSLEGSRLSYPTSSTTSNLIGNGLTNFSYQNSLLPFYSQPSAYEIASSSSTDSQCFNVNYSIPNEQYLLPSVSETISYHPSNSGDSRLGTENTTSTEYGCSENLQVSHYSNCAKSSENQNFIIRDLTNNSEINVGNVGNDSFNSESFIPLGCESYEEQADTASQEENLKIV